MHNCLRRICSLLFLVTLTTGVYAQSAWKNVHISAGSGFVTGIVAQPKVPGLFYIRTDVGGFYRWNPKSAAWIAITDSLPIQKRGDYGGESIAVDPISPNTVYIACGNGEAGTIYKSTNRGQTWKALGLKGVTMSGNAPMRWGGERLAIDPGNTQVMLFGSRSQGLWRSADGGVHWVQTALPFPSEGESGVQAVAFDPKTPFTVYAAVAENGVFESNDTGKTWTNISTTITLPERLTVGSDSTVWVTYHNGVSKYRQGTWTDCTPPGETKNGYCSLAINPRDSKNVLVTNGLWGDPAPPTMFETDNGGTSWTKLAPKVTTDVPWYHAMDPEKAPGSIKDFLYTPIANFLFDPNNPKSVWFVSAGGIYHTANIAQAGGPVFAHTENGHEELCVTALASPPTGPELIAGVMDVDGFVFDKGLKTYPSRTFLISGTNAGAGATASIAYEEHVPRNMVRLCVAEALWSSPAMVVASHDGGRVWSQDKSFPTTAPSGTKNTLAPLAVALSSHNPQDMVVVVRDNGDHSGVWYVKKRGMTGWTRCTGLPTTPAPELETMPIATDPLAGNIFYAYAGGTIYRSTDGGQSFQAMSHRPIGAPDGAGFFKLAVCPGSSGDLWLSEDADTPNYLSPSRPSWEGLYHSRDAGRTWTKVPGINRALNFSFGKASGSGLPTLYCYGRRTHDTNDQILRSMDLGKTWVDIRHPGQAIGDGPWEMEASRQTFGRVFIGTYGRGIFYSH